MGITRQITTTFFGGAQGYSYFGKVFGESRIIGRHICFTFLTLSLGDVPEGITRNTKYLLKIMIAASKKAIAHKWLQIDPPTIDDWLEIMKELHEMERLTFLMRLKYDLYIVRWAKWTRHWLE